MTGLYLGSTMPQSGKSLLAFSLGLLLQKAGCRVGYMKPLGRIPQKKDELPGDADALVVQELLGQTVAPNVLTPVMAPASLHELSLHDYREKDSLRCVCDAYAQIAADKDITLVSGSGSFPASGRFAGIDGFTLLRKLDLKALFVERYCTCINTDALLLLKDMLGPTMLGVVINDVPENEMRDVKGVLAPWLEKRAIPVFGIIGHEPDLAAIHIANLAHGLAGRIVAGSTHAMRMVNDFLIGTMQVDNFMLHLRRCPGSVVIVGGDRADLQLAAIHAQSPCIILTCNLGPSELIRSRAEAAGITLITVKEDTYVVARIMSRILKSKKICNLNQIRLAYNLVKNTLALQPILDRITATAG